MSPKTRERRNKGLPDFLYQTHSSANAKGEYRWKYLFPSRDPVRFTATRAVAIATARKANAKLMQDMPLVGKLVGSSAGRTVKDGFRSFEKEYLPTLSLSQYSVEDKKRRLRIMGNDLGHIEIKRLSVEAVADWLEREELKPRTRNVYRSTLIQVIKYWLHRGWIDHNPAELTLIKPQSKQRQRLELNEWIDIHGRASFAMQRAMELALVTAQRRGDIARMCRQNVTSGHLRVLQQKGEGKPTETRISIPLSAQQPDTGLILGDVIDSCFGQGIATNYFVHHPIGSAAKTGKPYQAVELTREFSKTRDACGLSWDGAPPTFHEQRSLASRLYKHSGRSEDWVQQLCGHEEAKTTRESYLSSDKQWQEIQW